MQVTLHEIFTDSFKTNCMTLNFLMPLDDKNATNCALLAGVLKRGCEKYGEMDQIACRLEELYGAAIELSSDKIGENLSFTIHCSYLDDRYALEKENVGAMTADVMSQILLHPLTEGNAFCARFFDQEKQNLADTIRAQINDKRVYATRRCKEITFAGEPYRFTSDGTLECLDEITAGSLYSFYRNMLKSAKTLATYVGRKTDVHALLEEYFPFLFSDAKTVSLLPVKCDPVTTKKDEEESMDVVQGKLSLGFRFSQPPEYYAARLFNVVFGASPVSKLFMNVREKLSLCYYCSSELDVFVNALFVSSGIESKNFAVARDEILRQLDDVKQGKFTDAEFSDAKLYLLDYVKGMKDSPVMMTADGIRRFLLGNEDGIDEQIRRISALTPLDIQNAAGLLQLDTVYFLHEKEFKA